MNTIAITARKLDTRVLLSTLWIVVMINMLKADIHSINAVLLTPAGEGFDRPELGW